MSKLSVKISIAAVSVLTALSLSGVTSIANAALTEAQITSILSLLSTFGADATTVANVNASLRGQATSASSGQATSGTTTTTTSSTAVPAVLLTSGNLTVGSTGEVVKALQQYLNASGYAVALSGAGSVGNESTYFGNATKAALAKWQAANGISATGYFGSITISKLNALALAAKASVITTPATPAETSTTISTSTAVSVPETTATTTPAVVTPSCPKEYSLKMTVEYPSHTVSTYTDMILNEFVFSATQPTAITKIKFTNSGTMPDYNFFSEIRLINSATDAILATSTISNGTIQFNLTADPAKADKNLMVSGGRYYIQTTILTPGYEVKKKITLDVNLATDITAVDYNDLSCAVETAKNNTFPIGGPILVIY
ncbi:MAG: peptidoglycan-binding domain-containing protein [Candidatus Pacebacteria bacterium]|nr:peptidoglycan-binding domain-containing protein [Candidatus Paceibacterota bacterium]